MTTTPPPQTTNIRSRRTTTVLVTAAATLLAAIVPVLIGLVLLLSLAMHRPALAGLTRWPHVDRDGVQRATLITGIGLLLIGAAQGVAALTAGLSITSPNGLAARTGLALAGEAALAITVACHLRRRGTARVP